MRKAKALSGMELWALVHVILFTPDRSKPGPCMRSTVLPQASLFFFFFFFFFWTCFYELKKILTNFHDKWLILSDASKLKARSSAVSTEVSVTELSIILFCLSLCFSNSISKSRGPVHVFNGFWNFKRRFAMFDTKILLPVFFFLDSKNAPFYIKRAKFDLGNVSAIYDQALIRRDLQRRFK